MMNKFKKGLIISISSLLIVGVLATAITVSLICLKRNSINKKVLTASEVNKNFDVDGIWYGKRSLVAKDFEKYNYSISFDCFDYININLEFVELLDCTEIIFNDSSDWFNDLFAVNKAIIWEKVNLIKIKNSNNNKKNLFIQNNILFINAGDFTFAASTISNRLIQTNIEFPNYDQLPFKTYLSISENFYNDNIFKNIQQIKIDSNCIIKIGASAFRNCNKMFESVTIVNNTNYHQNIYINNNAFTNTNLTSLNIASWYVDIGNEVFSDCKNLSEVGIAGFVLLLGDSSFKNCSNSLNVLLYYPSSLEIGNNCFSNNYANFSLIISSPPEINSSAALTYIFNNSAFSNINVDIECFNIYINNRINKDFFINSGLSELQFNKITSF